MPENTREHIAKEDFVTAMRRAGSRTITLERLEAAALYSVATGPGLFQLHQLDAGGADINTHDGRRLLAEKVEGSHLLLFLLRPSEETLPMLAASQRLSGQFLARLFTSCCQKPTKTTPDRLAPRERMEMRATGSTALCRILRAFPADRK